MTWRERERLLYLGSTFSLLPALTIVPAFASLVFQPSIPHATLWAFVLFPLLIVAEFFGVYKLVQSCVARPFTLLTMARDFSWSASAKEYVKVYDRARLARVAAV